MLPDRNRGKTSNGIDRGLDAWPPQFLKREMAEAISLKSRQSWFTRT